MIKFTIIDIFGYPNGILDLQKRFDKTLRNMLTVSEDLRRIAWKSMKIVLFI